MTNNSGLYCLLQENARRNPRKTAIICDEMRVTYEELLLKVNACALGLINAGAENNAVIILFPNGIEFVVSVFAVFAVNGIAVPLNPKFKESEIHQYIALAEPKVLFADEETVRQMNLEDVFSGKIIRQLPEYDGNAFHPPAPMDKAASLYMFSSGSTGA